MAVIGIGQSLRGDDAVGVEAVQTWCRDHAATAGRPEIRVECSELPGLEVLEMLDGVEAAILVDAVEGGSMPGAIHQLAAGELEAFDSSSKSAHGWGMAETLRLGRWLNPKLQQMEICVIGIEAAQYELGGSLSPIVQEALPQASAAIQRQVERLLRS